MIKKRKAENLYKSSLKVLRQVQMKNGGCLATPKGKRYPYVYPRDHAFCLLAFLSEGNYDCVKKGMQFILNAQLETGAFPQRYSPEGKDASYKPIQVDGTGLILYTLAEYLEQTHDLKFFNKNLEKIKKAIKFLESKLFPEQNLIYTPNSVHEFPPIDQGLDVWTNAICCAALRELSQAFSELKHKDSKASELSRKIKSGINNNLWNSRINSFVKVIRVHESSSVDIDADVSQLALCEFGVIPDNDKRMISTVKRIEKELIHPKLGGLCRYHKYEGRNNGGWGPWPHFTLLLAKHYIRLGKKNKAESLIKWVINTSYKGLLPEHLSTIEDFEEYVSDFTEAGILRKDRKIMIANTRKHPTFKKGTAYITMPLAWPHAEFIRTWNLYKKTFLK